MRYFIIGADGKKYGPADVDKIKQWLAENRLNTTSMVEEEGTGNMVSVSTIVVVSPATTVQAPYQPPTPTRSGPHSVHGGPPERSTGTFSTVQPAGPAAAPQHPGYGGPQPMPPSLENSSGQGEYSVVPPEIMGWNTGAFFWNWIWAIAHNTWIGLLAIPLGPIMCIVLGVKGNEWAWRNRSWDSVAHFRKVQGIWSTWAWVIFVINLVVVCAAVAVYLGMESLPERVTDKSGSISMVCPKGWEASSEDFPPATLIFLGPEYNGFRSNINYVKEDIGQLTLDKYVEKSMALLAEIVDDYRLESNRRTHIAGRTAAVLIYQAASDEEVRKVKQVIVLRDGSAHIMTFTGSVETFAADSVAFNKAVHTVEFL